MSKIRKKSSNQWLNRQKRDPYVLKRNKEGYRSRAAYKLIEINDKYHILKENIRILDLGAAPGGWLQVIQKKAQNSEIYGVDLLDIAPIANINIIKGDMQLILDMPDNHYFNLILSDIAPNFSGDHSIDHFKSINLCQTVLKIARKKLKKHGNLVIKIITGEDEREFIREIQDIFCNVYTFKPQASRQESSELYIIGMGFIHNNNI